MKQGLLRLSDRARAIWSVVAISSFFALALWMGVPDQYVSIGSAVVAAIVGLFLDVRKTIRLIWACLIAFMGTMTVSAVYRADVDLHRKAAVERSEAAARERRADSLYWSDKRDAQRRHDEEMSDARGRHQQTRDDMEALKQSSRYLQSAVNAGAMQNRIIGLAGEIFAFLSERHAKEPEEAFALMGAMPIPVGEYAEYIEVTADEFDRRYRKRVLSEITALRQAGLSDATLETNLQARAHPHVVREIAEGLVILSGDLIGAPS